MKYYYVTVQCNKETSLVSNAFVAAFDKYFSLVGVIDYASKLMKVDRHKVLVTFFGEIGKECRNEYVEFCEEK